MVKLGYLTPRRVREFLKIVGKQLLTCPKCQKNFNVKNWIPERQVRCTSCSTVLVLPTSEETIDASGSDVMPSVRPELDPSVDPIAPYDTTVQGPPQFEDIRLSEDSLLTQLPRDSKGRPMVDTISLLGRIGRGGMGAVYYAIHPRTHAEVAVKILPFHLVEADLSLVSRFVAEGKLAAELKDPHLIEVLDVGQEGVTHFLVMEFVRGETAGALLRRRKMLSERDALEIIAGATRGLACAHSHSIVHRDVKPDNIIVPEGGFHQAKLMDLGLSKSFARDQQTFSTLTGTAMGTPGFMAPEQIEDAKRVGPEADVFSMGATCYALLTGHGPFESETLPGILLKTTSKNYAPLPESVSQGTRALIDKCLKKNPRHRFEDGRALLAALARIQRSGVPHRDPVPDGAAVRNPERQVPQGDAHGAERQRGALTPPVRRPPGISWLHGVAAGVAAVLLLVLILVALRGKMSPARERPATDATEAARSRALKEDYKGALAELEGVHGLEADGLRVEYARLLEMQIVRRDRISKILQEVSTDESAQRFEDALAVLQDALEFAPDDPEVVACRERLLKKAVSSKTAEQKRVEFERYLAEAETSWSFATATDTSAHWRAVVEAATKAGPYAQTEDERHKVNEMCAHAVCRRDWAGAREAEAAGDFDAAVTLAGQACKSANPPRALLEFLVALEERARRARKGSSEFASLADAARAEKNPERAIEKWKEALSATDNLREVEIATREIKRLTASLDGAMQERLYRAVIIEAEESIRLRDFKGAEAKYEEARFFRKDGPEIAEGLKRAADLRRSVYRESMKDGTTALSKKDHLGAGAAFARALEAVPDDSDAKGGRDRAADLKLANEFNAAMADAKRAEQKSDWTEARQCYERALRVRRDDPNATQRLRGAEQKCGRRDISLKADGAVKMTFVLIRAGRFYMSDEMCEVILSKDYWIQTTEVTQEQWTTIMGPNPSFYDGANRPVETVSWQDCVDFCTKFSGILNGEKAMLPTEAEWEFACRAGTKTRWSFGDRVEDLGDYAWIDSNSGDRGTHPVAQKKANAWGLYDMHGNVWEWCQDWGARLPKSTRDPRGPDLGDDRVIRGGGFGYGFAEAACGMRNRQKPGLRSSSYGFRVVVK